MFVRLQKWIVFVLLILKVAVAHAIPQDHGLYLSYEQRAAVTFAMMASGESNENQHKYLERGMQFFQDHAKHPRHVFKVKNFEEFLTAFRGNWPNTQSVELDLQIVQDRGPRAIFEYKSDSARVQKQIDEYLQWQSQKVKNMAESSSGQKSASLMDPTFMAQTAMLWQTEAGKAQAKQKLLQASDQTFQQHLKEFDHIGERIATSGMAKTQDQEVKIVMQTILSEYFARLSLPSKKLIVSSYLGGDLQLGDIGKFEVMVQNSGPQLQKLLQVIARQGDLSPEMVKIFKGLENAVRPVPYLQVEKLLNAEKANYNFVYFEKMPLGVGTMAQVHRAKILVNEHREDVVVRFIKPDIHLRVQEDARILKEVAVILDSNRELAASGFPKMEPLINDITATVTAELSQDDTIARQKLAASRYNRESFLVTPEYKNVVEFHVPEIFPPAYGKSKFMVQEMVIGQKLDKEAAAWKDIAPNLKMGIVEELVRLWGTEAMFGDGFYHSDLHQGNFMIRVGEEKIRINLLDFGMGGKLTPDVQQHILALETGITLANAKIVAQSYWALSNKALNTVSEERFRELVEARMAQGYKTKDDIASDLWAKWAMNQGLRLPYDFININRGMTILKKLLEDAGSEKTISDIMVKAALKRPYRIYRSLVKEGGLTKRELLEAGRRKLLAPPLPPAAKPAVRISCEQVFQ